MSRCGPCSESMWIFFREDLTNTVKDCQSVDGFVTNALDERISMAKCVATVGGGGSLGSGNVASGCSLGSALSCLRIASPQFSVSREHAHMIMLMSCDVNCCEWNLTYHQRLCAVLPPQLHKFGWEHGRITESCSYARWFGCMWIRELCLHVVCGFY